MGKTKKWTDLTSLSRPTVKHGIIDPKFKRVRAWRRASHFNGLRLPLTWRWHNDECHECGNKTRYKEYASWVWVEVEDKPAEKIDLHEIMQNALNRTRPEVYKAYEAAGGFARFWPKEMGR